MNGDSGFRLQFLHFQASVGQTKFTVNATMMISSVGKCVMPPSFNNPLPFRPPRCLKASFFIPETDFFSNTSGFYLETCHKTVYVKVNRSPMDLSPILIHHHPLQVENCDSNPRLVVDEDFNIYSEMVKLLSVGGPKCVMPTPPII